MAQLLHGAGLASYSPNPSQTQHGHIPKCTAGAGTSDFKTSRSRLALSGVGSSFGTSRPQKASGRIARKRMGIQRTQYLMEIAYERSLVKAPRERLNASRTPESSVARRMFTLNLQQAALAAIASRRGSAQTSVPMTAADGCFLQIPTCRRSWRPYYSAPQPLKLWLAEQFSLELGGGSRIPKAQK